MFARDFNIILEFINLCITTGLVDLNIPWRGEKQKLKAQIRFWKLRSTVTVVTLKIFNDQIISNSLSTPQKTNEALYFPPWEYFNENLAIF